MEQIISLFVLIVVIMIFIAFTALMLVIGVAAFTERNSFFAFWGLLIALAGGYVAYHLLSLYFRLIS